MVARASSKGIITEKCRETFPLGEQKLCTSLKLRARNKVSVPLLFVFVCLSVGVTCTSTGSSLTAGVAMWTR